MNVQKTLVHFSASLRKKSLWPILGPALTSSIHFSLKETTATAIDMTIPIYRPQHINVLHILFMDCSDSSDDMETKIRAFMSAIRPTNALDLLVLVNKQEDGGLHSLMALQLLQFDIGHIPTLMANSVETILPLLEKHITQLKQPSQIIHNPTLTANLVAHATSRAPSRPLLEQDANRLTGLFPSIKDLEEGTRTEQGQALIHELLDVRTAKEVIEFWEDEWLV